MNYINVSGFTNNKRYKKILIWRRKDLGERTNLVFSGEVLDNFSIRRARKRSTKLEELKTNTEVYCCDSIQLIFNKSNKKLVNILSKSDFNIFEIGFIHSDRRIKKYHISFNVLKSKWKDCLEIQDMGDTILVSLNDITKEKEN